MTIKYSTEIPSRIHAIRMHLLPRLNLRVIKVVNSEKKREN